MAKVSTVIITYNEEERTRCRIDALLKVADDFVAVDSYPTVNALMICETRSRRFIELVCEGYIEQQNFALFQTTCDFVSSLDADEYLSEDLTQSIPFVKENQSARACSMKSLSSFKGRWIQTTDWHRDRRLRLWFGPKGRWGRYNPRDRVIVKTGSCHLFVDIPYLVDGEFQVNRTSWL